MGLWSILAVLTFSPWSFALIWGSAGSAPSSILTVDFSDRGELFVWGKNIRGCLGIGKTDDQYFPWRVRAQRWVTAEHSVCWSNTRFLLTIKLSFILIVVKLLSHPPGDSSWASGGRSLRCWPHGGAGEVSSVRLDVCALTPAELQGPRDGGSKPSGLCRTRTSSSAPWWRQRQCGTFDSSVPMEPFERKWTVFFLKKEDFHFCIFQSVYKRKLFKSI